MGDKGQRLFRFLAIDLAAHPNVALQQADVPGMGGRLCEGRMIPDLLPRELTPEERDHAEKWLARWIAFSRSTEPVDRPAAERAVTRTYEAAGFKPPETWHWHFSPRGLVSSGYRFGKDLKWKLYAPNVSRNIPEMPPLGDVSSGRAAPFFVSSSFGVIGGGGLFTEFSEPSPVTGLWSAEEITAITRPWVILLQSVSYFDLIGTAGIPIDGQWLARQSFIHEHILHSPEEDGVACRIRALAEASVRVGIWLPSEDTCEMCERPTELHVDDNGELHRLEGPAVAYPDGFCLYVLRGIPFTDNYWFETSPTDWDPRRVLRVSNVEERRELIRVMGLRRLLKHLKHRVLDRTDGYVLYSVQLDNSVRDARFLEMTHASVPGLTLLEGVEGSTVEEAINWRAGELGENIDWNPYQLT